MVQGTAADWKVGHELALLHVLEQLSREALFNIPSARAQAIADARAVALQDDSGRTLDAALVQHGAAPTPAREHPIRFVRRKPSA